MRRKPAARVAREIKRIYKHEIPNCTEKEAAFLLGAEIGINWYFGICMKSPMDLLLWWRAFGRKSPLDQELEEMFPSKEASETAKLIFKLICDQGLEESGPTAAQIKANQEQ